MACFSRQDWPGLLSLVTDDVERWEVGGPTPSRGKTEFDQGVRPGQDVVSLDGEIDRLLEEGNVVVADGTVRVSLKDGKAINVRFCDLFEFEGEKVKRLTAYTSVV